MPLVVSDAVPVPEPETAALLAFSVPVMRRGQRRGPCAQSGELVRDYVDENYTERELEEIRARIAHGMLSVGMEEGERERLLEGLEEELGEG